MPYIALVALKSTSADAVLAGRGPPVQHQLSKAEQEAAAMHRAQKLDSDLDYMFAWLLSAYKRPIEAMGDKLVLHQMSSSVKLTEPIDDADDDDGKPAFTATRQVSHVTSK